MAAIVHPERTTADRPIVPEVTETLVLLHGGGNHSREWNTVRSLLPEFETIAPNMSGHADGPAIPPGPVTVKTFADSVERAMDGAGLGTAHIAGNSLGGWVAMELMRRGRARSVAAFSPAGGSIGNAESRSSRTM